jgi:hypothetical protein
MFRQTEEKKHPKFRGGFALTQKKPTLARKVPVWVELNVVLEAEEQGFNIASYIEELKRRIRSLQQLNQETIRQLEALAHEGTEYDDRDRRDDPKLQQGSK